MYCHVVCADVEEKEEHSKLEEDEPWLPTPEQQYISKWQLESSRLTQEGLL